MQVTDLMLGDIVTFKDCQNDEHPIIMKIWQINADGDAVVSINGDVALDVIDSIEFDGWALRIINDFPEREISINPDASEKLYVHELQNALRLCGIEKEIKL